MATTSTASNTPTTYPVLKTEDEVQALINSTINDKNAQIVKTAIQTKQTSLNHYIKIMKKWRLSRVKILYPILIISVLADLISAIYNILIDVNVIGNSIVPEIVFLTTFALITPMVVILSRFFTLNISKYNDICINIKECIDKVYILWNKSIVDNIITDDELAQFQSILYASDQTVKQDQADINKNNSDVLSALKSLFSEGIKTIEQASSSTSSTSSSNVPTSSSSNTPTSSTSSSSTAISVSG